MLHFRQFLFFLYLCFITYSSLISSDQIMIQAPDKLLHCTAYVLMVLLAGWSLSNKTQFFFSLPLLFVYGISIEIAQSFTNNREASFLDVMANASGLLIGYCLLHFAARIPFFAKYIPAKMP